jgi:glucose-6-phosphate 1-dehydrogenase
MSTTLVILGATGDLSRRKLIPALFTLVLQGTPA